MLLDSYSETSQVNSSCLDAGYEHAGACSTSLLRESCLSPISFFSRREATNPGKQGTFFPNALPPGFP